MKLMVMDINRMIRHRWSQVEYFADTYARFYEYPRTKKVLSEIDNAIIENLEADEEMRRHFEKGNLINYV